MNFHKPSFRCFQADIIPSVQVGAPNPTLYQLACRYHLNASSWAFVRQQSKKKLLRILAKHSIRFPSELFKHALGVVSMSSTYSFTDVHEAHHQHTNSYTEVKIKIIFELELKRSRKKIVVRSYQSWESHCWTAFSNKKKLNSAAEHLESWKVQNNLTFR